MRLPPLVKLTSVLALALVFAAQSLSVATEDFPQCWRDCVRSNGLSCKDTDLNCLSLFRVLGFPTASSSVTSSPRLIDSTGICSSAPSHLSPLLTCAVSNCPAASASINTLQLYCEQSSSPIPSSLLSSVTSKATDVAHPTLLLASPTSLEIIHTSTMASSAASATATGKNDDGGSQGGGDGTVLDLEGRGGKREGGCLLGLTVGILAGIAWF